MPVRLQWNHPVQDATMHIRISHSHDSPCLSRSSRHGAPTISFKRNDLEVIDVDSEGGMIGGSEFVEGDAAC
jgi:hypothetical protein